MQAFPEDPMRPTAVLPLLLFATALRAQTPAATYLERYRELMNLAPSGQVVDVHHLVLTRDAGRLTFENGTLYLCSLRSAGGDRVVGAVFEGGGRFTFVPPDSVDGAELRRFADSTAMNDSISEAVLLFADSTPAQLAALKISAGPVPDDVRDHVRDFVKTLKGANEGEFHRYAIEPMLNGDTTGLFFARVKRTHGDDVLLEIVPTVSEGVRLSRRTGDDWDEVVQFAAQGEPRDVFDRVTVPSYRIDVRLSQTVTGDLDFAATATFPVVAARALGPWIQFELDGRLSVDSARWGAGGAAPWFKAKDNGVLWVRAARRLGTGDSLELTVAYHGKLIDREGDWFYVPVGAPWYPVNEQGRPDATYDITYHTPSWYPIASIGERVDSSVADRVLTTRWVERTPTDLATFTLGLFDTYHVQQPGALPIDVLISEEAHRQLSQAALALGTVIPQQSHMKENVATDVSNSYKLFTSLFGECPCQHFYVAEIPYGEGVSFPGLIDLSWITFQGTLSIDGFEEFFRAHEVSHQWWGNAVAPGSYHDYWLSEGLASFSGLWYLETVRKHNDEYFKFLAQYQNDIGRIAADAGPVWLGPRTATRRAPNAYQVIVYEKGAWIFHMLRILMLDFRTMKEDRFTAMMRDYYQTFRGRRATTADFQYVVERHVQADMSWFFDQWVKGTAIPTYHVAWTTQSTPDGKFIAQLHVTQEHVPPEFRAIIPVSVDLGDDRTATFRIDVKGADGLYTSPPLPTAPRHLEFNVLHAVLADVKME